ncbi:hypothetical protein HXX76_015266 [Chlamydomonas incerta]|uniref:LysM domain-containing protein n=1 Tax=Chlamydomonas incerta TaxID=51695 RepID=A0A835SA53_CHLIN|nr:hypothetical protein HXX76_015266 [Chlamydomonas incerta]|eukprot:KAG2423518.1 hypothetical protein HXX76_015266 [Chlamydomonas incerta]
MPPSPRRYGGVVPPEEFDWRPTGLIRAPVNQLGCGTCYVHAVVHGVEALTAIQNGSATPANTSAAVLPEDQVIRCGGAAVAAAACEGGWVGESYIYAAITGLLSSPDWGAALADPTLNNGGDGQQCPFRPPSLLPPADDSGAAPLSLPEYFRRRGIRIYGWETVPATEGALLQALSNQPVVALVHASRDWFSYRGGLFAGGCSSAPSSANHAVLVVGYTAAAWVVKNSWGTDWGDGGYMLLPRGPSSGGAAAAGGPCGLLGMLSYPILDPVAATRRGDLLQQGFCSGLYKVDAAEAAAGVTLRQLAAAHNVSLDDLVRANSHLRADEDARLEALVAYYLPPCSRNTPPPPVPTVECGTLYRVSLVGSPNSSAGLVSRNLFAESGAHGRRLQREHFHAQRHARHGRHGQQHRGPQPHPHSHPHLQHPHPGRQEDPLLASEGTAGVTTRRRRAQQQQQQPAASPPAGGASEGSSASDGWLHAVFTNTNTSTAISTDGSSSSEQLVLDMRYPDGVGAGTLYLAPRGGGGYGARNARQLWRLEPQANGRSLLRVNISANGYLLCASSEGAPDASLALALCDPEDARQWVQARPAPADAAPDPAAAAAAGAPGALLGFAGSGSAGGSPVAQPYGLCLYGKYVNRFGLRYMPFLISCDTIPAGQQLVLEPAPPPPAVPYQPAWLRGPPGSESQMPALSMLQGYSAPRVVRLANGAMLSQRALGAQVGFANGGPEGATAEQQWRLFRGPVDYQGRQTWLLGLNLTTPDTGYTWLACLQPHLGIAPPAPAQAQAPAPAADTARSDGGGGGSSDSAVGDAGGGVQTDAQGYPLGRVVWGVLNHAGSDAAAAGGDAPSGGDSQAAPMPQEQEPGPQQQQCVYGPEAHRPLDGGLAGGAAMRWAFTEPCQPDNAFQVMELLGSALRYVLDTRGTYLSAPAARVGAPVGYLAAASPADQSPDPSQLWYLRPVADGPAGAKRYQLALAASGQQLCATVAASLDSLTLQECDAVWDRQAFAFPGADNLAPGGGAAGANALPVGRLPYLVYTSNAGAGGSGRSYCVTGAAYQPDFAYARARVASTAQCDADSSYTTGLFVGKPLQAYAGGLAAPLMPLPATTPPRSRAGYVAVYDVRGAALSAAASGAVTLRYTESGVSGGGVTAAKQALLDSQLWRVRPAASPPGADWFTATNYVFGDSLCLSAAAAAGAADAYGPLTLRPCDASDTRQRLVFWTADGRRVATRTIPLDRTQLGFADAGSPCLASVTPSLMIAYRAPFEVQAASKCGARADETQLFEVADSISTATYQHLRWWNGGPSQTSSVAGYKPKEASCPPGAYVTGLEGTLWTGLPALEACVFAALLAESPLGGMLYSNLADELSTWDVRQQQLGFALSFKLRCSDGTAVYTADAEASDYLLGWLTPATSYSWSETCPGGYDRLRAGTRAFLDTPYAQRLNVNVMKLVASLRCRSGRRWTLYTVNGAGVSKRLATYNSTSGDGSRLLPDAALVARLKQTCGPAGSIKTATDTTVTFYDSPQTSVNLPTAAEESQLNVSALLASPYRSLPQLLDLQSFPAHRLENMAGAAACPDNQVLTGVYTRSGTPALGSAAPYNGWQGGRVIDLPVALWPHLSFVPWVLAVDSVVCRAVASAWAHVHVTYASTELSDSPAASLPPPPEARADNSTAAPAPPAGMVHLVSAEPVASAGGSARRTKDLACAGDGAFITGVYAADDQIDLNVLGVRCSDGSSAFIGTQRREAGAPLPAYIDVLCAEGFDAVKKPWGTPSDGKTTSRGLGSFALRCSSAAGQYDSFAGSAGDGRFWTQLGAYKAVLARGDLYAASEAFLNSEDVYGCADAGAVITQITVVYDDNFRAVNTLHFFCGERPRLSADSSFYDVAFRYGITLSDLFAANPDVNSSLPLSAYNNTVLAVPQLCGSISQQPPITTIASSCPRYWPLPNITVTGQETCGSIAIAFCNRDLRFLNSVNNGICPNATIRISRGVRLCIPPRASVSSIGHRRQLVRSWATIGIEGTQAVRPQVQLQGALTMGHARRGLLQSDAASRAGAVGAVCTLKTYVSVGASCGSIAAAYNLTDMQMYDYNPELRCEALAAGSVLCVERSDSGVEDSLEPLLVVGQAAAGPAVEGGGGNDRNGSRRSAFTLAHTRREARARVAAQHQEATAWRGQRQGPVAGEAVEKPTAASRQPAAADPTASAAASAVGGAAVAGAVRRSGRPSLVVLALAGVMGCGWLSVGVFGLREALAEMAAGAMWSEARSKGQHDGGKCRER